MMLKIVVHNDHVVAHGVSQASHDGVMLSEILCQADVRHAVGEFLHERQTNFMRAVPAPIVHEHDLQCATVAKDLDESLSQRGECCLGIKHRDHDADVDMATSCLNHEQSLPSPAPLVPFAMLGLVNDLKADSTAGQN